MEPLKLPSNEEIGIASERVFERAAAPSKNTSTLLYFRTAGR
jgi:hypothetical protein